MDQELSTTIDRILRLSYFRGIDKNNPVDFRMQPNPNSNTTWIIVCAMSEPTYARTPYNVLWVVADATDNNYGKMLRRVNHEASSFTYRSEWELVTDLTMAYSDIQYYRPIIENPYLYGIDDQNANLPPATTIENGIARLARSDTGAVLPIGILSDDARMSDDRYPTDHDHPNYARSMVKINATSYAIVDVSAPPLLGMTLFLQALHPTIPNVYLAQWRLPTESDVDFVDRSLLSIAIIGPTTVNEQTSTQYVVRATYADGRVEDVVPNSWSITQNPSAASIDRLTGILTSNNITQNTQIVMSASFTADGITHSATLAVNIKAGVELTSLVIEGPDSLNSKELGQYEVIAHFSDGSTSSVNPANFTSSNAAAVVQSGLRIQVAQIFTNGTTTLSANYTFDGTQKTATKNVALVAESKIAVSLDVIGDTQISEGTQSTPYTYVVHYNDGSSKPLTDVTTLTTDKPAIAQIVVPNKLLVPQGNINADTVVRLLATYKEGGATVQGYLDVLVLNVTLVTPTAFKIRIQGGPDANASQHNESQALTVLYTAEFSSNPGTWVDVSADPGFVASLVSPTHGCVLSSDKRTLTLADVTGDKTVTIQASITRNGVTRSANYVVTVVDTDIYLLEARVRLAKAPNASANSSTEDESQTLGLVYAARYSNNPSAWIAVPSTHAGLEVTLANAAGATLAADKSSITLPDVTNSTQTVTINAQFTDLGSTEAASYAITIRDMTVYVTGFRIRLNSAPNAATNSSSHTENQTVLMRYQLEYSNAPGTWVNINGNANLSAIVKAPTNGVTFSGGDITKVALPNVTGNTSATIEGTYDNAGTPMKATYVFTITDVVVTVVELRARLESNPTALESSSTHDENQTIRMIYRARFSNAPSTWVDVSTHPELTAQILAPTLGVTFGTDKRDVNLPDVSADSSVILRATYTLNGTPTVSDYTINIHNVSVGPSISPRFGRAPVQAYAADYGQPAFYNLLTSGNLTGTSGEEITTGDSADQQQLWYMLYPKAWGYLYVVNKGSGLAGSWDGGKITTGDGQFGSPAEVSINGTDYYVYRVTFPYGPGPITWKVTYGSSSPDSGIL